MSGQGLGSKKMEKSGDSEMHKEEGGGGKKKLSGAYNKLRKRTTTA